MLIFQGVYELPWWTKAHPCKWKSFTYPIYPIRSFHVEFWRCSSLDGQNRTIWVQMVKTCGFWVIHIPCICTIWNEISLVQDFVHQPCGWVRKQFFQLIPTGLVGFSAVRQHQNKSPDKHTAFPRNKSSSHLGKLLQIRKPENTPPETNIL